MSQQTDDLTAFLDEWRQLYDTLKKSDPENPASKEEDDAFLELKSRIARRQAQISVTYDLDNHFTDSVMSVINQIVSLNDYASLSPTQIKKIDTDWHSLFILINGQIGSFEAQTVGNQQNSSAIRIFKNPIVILLVLVGLIIGGVIIGQKYLQTEEPVLEEVIE